ncbi:hypothetical protein Tco_0485961, partial [Tanacetum coccineum]
MMVVWCWLRWGGGCGGEGGGGEMVTMAWWCVVMAGVGWQRWLDGWGGARVEWRWRPWSGDEGEGRGGA